MKAAKIIDFIKTSGIEQSQFDTFNMYEETHDGKVAFVERYFGGDFVAGSLKTGSDYVAFWDDAPQGVADAIVTDGEGHQIKVFEIE